MSLRFEAARTAPVLSHLPGACPERLYPRASPGSHLSLPRYGVAGLASPFCVYCQRLVALPFGKVGPLFGGVSKGVPGSPRQQGIPEVGAWKSFIYAGFRAYARRCPIHAGSRGAFRKGIRQCPAALFVLIANSLNVRYGVAAPCRTPCTVCGLPPCIEK